MQISCNLLQRYKKNCNIVQKKGNEKSLLQRNHPYLPEKAEAGAVVAVQQFAEITVAVYSKGEEFDIAGRKRIVIKAERNEAGGST